MTDNLDASESTATTADLYRLLGEKDALLDKMVSVSKGIIKEIEIELPYEIETWQALIDLKKSLEQALAEYNKMKGNK